MDSFDGGEIFWVFIEAGDYNYCKILEELDRKGVINETAEAEKPFWGSFYQLTSFHVDVKNLVSMDNVNVMT